MILQMILHWLLSVFPAEMKQGWRLVRPDLLLWLALSALLAVAALALPEKAETGAAVLPALVGLTTALLTATLPPVLFTAAATGREVTWSHVWRYLLLRAPILLGYWILALLVALIPAMVVGEIVSLALRGTSAEIPLSAFSAVVVFVAFAVRFSFLPFLAILFERGQVAETLWSVPRAPWLGFFVWPLATSATLTRSVRWRLTPYVLLIGIVPNLPRMAETALLLPAEILCQMLALTVQGVLYGHFCAQAAAAGLPPAVLIESEV